MKKPWYKNLLREIRFCYLLLHNRLQTVKWPILVVLLLSVVFVSLYHGHSWEAFEHQQLLDSLDRISIAFISAFVFFFVNIQMEAEKRRIKMAPYLHNKISRLISLRRTVFAALRLRAGLDERRLFSSSSELSACCGQLRIETAVQLAYPVDRQFHSWTAMFDWLVQENQETIRDLLLLKEFLRSDIIQGLLAVEDKMIVLKRINLRERQNPEATLEAYVALLYDYKRLCEELGACFHGEYLHYRAEHQYRAARARLRRQRSLFASGLRQFPGGRP